MHFSLTRMHYKFITMVRFWSFWVTVGISWNRLKLFSPWPETFCFCAWTWRSYVCPSKRGRVSNVALSSFTECFNCQLYTVASHYFFARFLITTGLVDILWVCSWNNNSLKLQKGSCRRIFIEQNDRMSAYRGRFSWRGYNEGLNMETSHTWIVHSEVFQNSGDTKDIFFKQYLPCTDKVYFDFEFLNDVEWFRKRLFRFVFFLFSYNIFRSSCITLLNLWKDVFIHVSM